MLDWTGRARWVSSSAKGVVMRSILRRRLRYRATEVVCLARDTNTRLQADKSPFRTR